MSFSNIKSVLLPVIALLYFTLSLSAEIRESELEKMSSSILKKIISDNKDESPAIREYLNGVVVGNNSGMKLIDKLALFVLNSNKNGVKLHRTLFFQNRKESFMLLLVFNDEEQEENLLHLTYSFEKRRKICTLKDIYFSLVFGEKKEQVDNFFRYR
jgi:hypothetical protein